MARKIEAYNASYPAAFYEIGTVYAFYAQGNVTGKVASEKVVSRFSSTLKSLEEQQQSNAIKSVRGGGFDEPPATMGRLIRYYAVVIEKTATNIEVMFLNYNNGKEAFLTRKYTVSGSCTTDGKDLMAPTTHTNVAGVNATTSKVGGITKTGGSSGKVGGITKVGESSTKVAKVGGITRTKRAASSASSSLISDGGSVQRIGGITRIRK